MTDKDNNSEWTAWRVWLHPGRAVEVIDNAEIMENELRRNLEAEALAIEEIRTEAAETAGERDSLKVRLENAENEVALLRRELAESRRRESELKSELEEHEDVEKQLQAFDEKLKKFTDLKNDYEKKIRSLEAQLRDARIAKAENTPKIWPSAPSDDWLMELPDEL